MQLLGKERKVAGKKRAAVAHPPTATSPASTAIAPSTSSGSQDASATERVVQQAEAIETARVDGSLTASMKKLKKSVAAPAAPSSNWARMQQRLPVGMKRKRDGASTGAPPAARPRTAGVLAAATSSPLATPAPSIALQPHQTGDEMLTARLALDCEMVGVGHGKRSALARVVVVNFDEVVVFSCFVKPTQRVTDYRTFVSGVKPEHMVHALPMRQVLTEVARIVRSRILIGHALANDLKALKLHHPSHMMRDTALYEPFRKQVGEQKRPQRLKALAEEHLGWEIQTGSHSPCEDAVAALRLYKQHMHAWERAPLPVRAPEQLKKKGDSKRQKKVKRVKRGTS